MSAGDQMTCNVKGVTPTVVQQVSSPQQSLFQLIVFHFPAATLLFGLLSLFSQHQKLQVVLNTTDRLSHTLPGTKLAHTVELLAFKKPHNSK